MKQTHNNISSELTPSVDSVNYVSGMAWQWANTTLCSQNYLIHAAILCLQEKFPGVKSESSFTELEEKANEYKMEQYCENMLSLNNIMDY